MPEITKKLIFMLKRKIQIKLENWYKSEHKKALMINGARQVGKTTAVREFAKKYYSHFVEINFVKNPEAKIAFDGELSTATIRANLSALGYGKFKEGNTLVFFDEIQECPNARTAIKFLVEDGVFDYIESGSLLGINYKHVTSYPVGFETEIVLYPMDFEEYLWAREIDETIIDILKNAYINKSPVPEFIHQQINKLYREYLIIGGMPDVVQKFVNTRDVGETVNIQKSILATYRSDISNYAGKQQTIVRQIFDSITSELGKQDKRFVLSNMEKGASFRKYEYPTQWLVDAGIAYYSFNTKVLEVPFEAVENRRLFKLYMVDTGLLCSTMFRGIQFQVLNGDISVNEGALTENFIACQLASKGYSLHYYDKKSKQELDFVVADKQKIRLIEVKSGKDYKRHTSLNRAIEENKSKIEQSIVFSKENLEMTEDILYLPLYMSMFIEER